MRQSEIETLFLAAVEAGAKNAIDPQRLDPLLKMMPQIRLDDFSVDCLTDAYGMLRAGLARKTGMRPEVHQSWRRLADRVGFVVVQKNTP